MKIVLRTTLLLVVLLSLASCAPARNELANQPDQGGKVAGFWQGLWHGFILPFTFVISLFAKDMGIYAIHNNGGWYNFGYFLGAVMILGGGGRGATRRRKVG